MSDHRPVFSQFLLEFGETPECTDILGPIEAVNVLKYSENAK